MKFDDYLTTTSSGYTVYLPPEEYLKEKDTPKSEDDFFEIPPIPKPSFSEDELREMQKQYSDAIRSLKVKTKSAQRKVYSEYILVLWPDSQTLMEKDWFIDCILMNDKAHLGSIGASAYFVPKELYETLKLSKDGKETKKS